MFGMGFAALPQTPYRMIVMTTIRPVNLPADRDALLRLDTSFTTGRIYRVVAGPDGFQLVEAQTDPPLTKAFPLDDELGDERIWEHGLAAEEAGAIVGFLALHHEPWNGRMAIWHFYVSPERRGMGLGRRLLDAAEAYARSRGARCLWLETSSVNEPAIQFYRRAGFTLCGLDTSLYDPAGPAAGETALYFVRHLAH